MSTFDYSSLPLSQREIRIFELLPAAEKVDPIMAQLYKAPLDIAPPFSALSYTWGDASVKNTIFIGAYTLSITASLATALRALRATDTPVLLWIDQICINQTDHDEKSQQIPLMEHIYSGSIQTIGWLGESTTVSDLAMDYLEALGVRAKDLGLGHLDATQYQVLQADEQDLDAGVLSMGWRVNVLNLVNEQGCLLELPALDGMIKLATLPYFERGWIQQEIALPRNLILRWGGKTIDADTFSAAIQLYQIYVYKSMPTLISDWSVPRLRALGLDIQRAMLRMSPIYNSLIMRRKYHSQDQRPTLTTARLIRQLSSAKFTQPRDHIYGLLGIAADKDHLNIKVDVSLPWEDTFTDATKRITHLTQDPNSAWGGINFLSLVRFPKSSSALPSWVPDLTDLQTTDTLSSATAALAPAYNVSAGLTHEPDGLDFLKPRTLHCRGIVVDRITVLGETWQPGSSERFSHHTGLGPLSRLAEFADMSARLVAANPFSNHPFRTNPERLTEAAWRVPVLDREAVNNTSMCRRATVNSRDGYDMVKWTMKYEELCGDLCRVITGIPLTEEETAELDSKCAGSDDIMVRIQVEVEIKMRKNNEFQGSRQHVTYDTLMDAFKTRVAFLGAEGFVGIGPLGMKTGDVVCVLAGGSFPFVLREVDGGEKGQYELVGEAYCDGIMDGEVLNLGIPEQEFVLS